MDGGRGKSDILVAAIIPWLEKVIVFICLGLFR